MGAYVVHHATAAGSRWKAVTCYTCATEFAYLRSAEAKGEATTMWWNFWRDNAGRARNEASQKLDVELDGSSPIRCPGCERFQPAMFGAIRRGWAAEYTWMPFVAALAVVAIAGFVGRRDALTLSPGDFIEAYLENIFNLDHWLGVIAGAVVAGVIGIRLAARRIDPNADRDRWSTARGTRRAEYEASQRSYSRPELNWGQ
jgi:hypothetical protein